MDTLILEDFRCFASPGEGPSEPIPIRPLTLLVGENSTGKTSFLAAVRAAYDLRLGQSPDFNEEPFHLGSYDQIANFRGGRAGRAKSFAIGQSLSLDQPRSPRLRNYRRLRRSTQGEIKMSIMARFRSTADQPALSEFHVSSEKYEVEIQLPVSTPPVVSFSTEGRVMNRQNFDVVSSWIRLRRFEVLDYIRVARGNMREDGIVISPDDREGINLLTDLISYNAEPRPYAFAPIRTSPQRTYEPAKEVRDPEGAHIPQALARLLDNGDTSDFRNQIEAFGKDSGLYSSIGIRKLGRLGSDPFQIEVKHPSGGRARNLVDVGYGVSQAIPIIADAVSTEPGSMLLIQQPEVHLHPRAQAAMGSFFANLAASGRNRLVVETHSDHLVDRVRMDVRDERIKASDVVILYFDQGERGVDIHPIEVDARGHPVEVPPGYRSFFLEEDRRFFGVGP